MHTQSVLLSQQLVSKCWPGLGQGLSAMMSGLSIEALEQSSSNFHTAKKRWLTRASFPHGEADTLLATDAPEHEPYTIQLKGLMQSQYE